MGSRTPDIAYISCKHCSFVTSHTKSQKKQQKNYTVLLTKIFFINITHTSYNIKYHNSESDLNNATNRILDQLGFKYC